MASRKLALSKPPQSTTAYYQPGLLMGSQAEYFRGNTYKIDTRPKYEMEALTLHEVVHGHHLLLARARELKDVHVPKEK